MTKQCASCGGFCGNGCQRENVTQPEQEQHWNEDEWRRNNWRCSHGWLRREQCEICNAAQEPPEWAGIKEILDEYGLQAIDFVADFKAALALPAQEPVATVEGRIKWDGRFALHCGAEVKVGDKLYTTPPQRQPLTAEQREKIFQGTAGMPFGRAISFAIEETEAHHGIKAPTIQHTNPDDTEGGTHD